MKRTTIINEEGLFEKAKRHPDIDCFSEINESCFSLLFKNEVQKTENNLEKYLSGFSTEELEKELERRQSNS